jgi:hypothetical protein
MTRKPLNINDSDDDAFNYRNNFGFWQLFVEVFDK